MCLFVWYTSSSFQSILKFFFFFIYIKLNFSCISESKFNKIPIKKKFKSSDLLHLLAQKIGGDQHFKTYQKKRRSVLSYTLLPDFPRAVTSYILWLKKMMKPRFLWKLNLTEIIRKGGRDASSTTKLTPCIQTFHEQLLTTFFFANKRGE